MEKEYLLSNSAKSIELSDQRIAINKILEDIRSQARHVDSTLDQMSEAETKKISNRIDTIEKKMLRAEKKNQEVALLGLALNTGIMVLLVEYFSVFYKWFSCYCCVVWIGC